MKKEYLKNNWRKLDNTAKIFSMDEKDNMNIFRYSVILKQKISKSILKKAVEKTIKQYDAFKVKLGSGLFWNYLERNNKEIIVTKENDVPCKLKSFKKNNDYLFKVTYYKKKINLDVFHILTDGSGAAIFLKSIIYNYLNIKHNIPFNQSLEPKINYQDQYIKNYNKKIKTKNRFKIAYSIKEKINKKINNTYHYIMNVKNIKNVCKKYQATITEYLTAKYIYAIYLSLHNKKSKKEIIITMPINLRKYYEVDTLSNFFSCAYINPEIIKNKLTTFEEIIQKVKQEFKEKINFDKVKSYLKRDLDIGRNIGIRLVPLFIKKPVMKYVLKVTSKRATSTLSNVGIINIDDKYKKYIDNILVLVMPNKNEKLKCTICSYDDKLNLTINSNIDDVKFEKTFLNLLQQEIKNIKLESNNNVNIIN